MVGAILVVLLFLLPNFKPRRARFESLNYGRNPHSQKEHIEVKRKFKFGVNRANIEQDLIV